MRPKIGQGFEEMFSGGFPGECYGADNHGNRERRTLVCISAFFFFFSGLIVVVFLFCFIFACEVTQPFSVLASHKVFLFAG